MDHQSWKELACLAVGAALVDKDVRARLPAIPLWPLSMMVEGMREGDAGRVWRGLERGYGLEPETHQRVIDRVLDELERAARVQQVSLLAEDLVAAQARGQGPDVDRLLDSMKEVFRRERNGKAR